MKISDLRINNKVVSINGFINGKPYIYDPTTRMLVYNPSMNEDPVQLNPEEFNYRVSTIASDGELIIMRDKGKIVDIVSLQFRTLDTQTPKVDVVSSVRLPDGINGLKKLRKNIDDTISQFENREP